MDHKIFKKYGDSLAKAFLLLAFVFNLFVLNNYNRSDYERDISPMDDYSTLGIGEQRRTMYMIQGMKYTCAAVIIVSLCYYINKYFSSKNSMFKVRDEVTESFYTRLIEN